MAPKTEAMAVSPEATYTPGDKSLRKENSKLKTKMH